MFDYDNNEYFPGELLDGLLAITARETAFGEAKFTGHDYGKQGGYYACFERTDAHGKTVPFKVFIGYTKAERNERFRRGIHSKGQVAEEP
jgi:hypothetical protein